MFFSRKDLLHHNFLYFCPAPLPVTADKIMNKDIHNCRCPIKEGGSVKLGLSFLVIERCLENLIYQNWASRDTELFVNNSRILKCIISFSKSGIKFINLL